MNKLKEFALLICRYFIIQMPSKVIVFFTIASSGCRLDKIASAALANADFRNIFCLVHKFRYTNIIKFVRRGNFWKC